MIAETNVAGLALIVVGAALIALLIAVAALRHRARGTRAGVPATMRPGPSDQGLETPLLLKLQGWGVVVVTFFVLWFPLMWLLEPGTNLNQEDALRTDAIARGAKAVQPYSEENGLGVGCVRCHGNALTGGVINALDSEGKPALAYPPNLTTVCGGPSTGHPRIFTVDDIFQVISEGRGAMPSWSIRFAGALDDQQINDLVLYLVDLSSQNPAVPFENNVCLNKEASDAALQANIDAGSPFNPRDP
jgi:mono/diheme cytochrome c family protein